ncbi:undecaprenyl/decaprenyl-phosphate alpha-N-acetylglucosaminyl 1-phosphate transferase [Flammeovirga pectinis]|uniref:Undecaprenyl/decaprenyl-phosphate alpha-N-acetylglucosaminyl 1-phosphate transferase n=1 Tax=Flammeovirga pectinis TaxID=2494373 RepID=A0A3S9P446_9BACT|nr:MraY family glycosyltransferase [Flammeovirga pectinis]AZQ62908.1 undecaprenyl/decaprenyl-phosphate alpha-N-acetylglucosaminyl 1-phosphate transferase [Flammeovirga pectinis]
MNLSTLLLSLVLGAITSFIITRVLITQAVKYNIVDKPRADRFHSKTTALMGGIGIMVSFIIVSTFLEILPLWWSIPSTLGICISMYLLFNNQIKKSYVASCITVIAGIGGIFLMFPENPFDQKMIWLFSGAEIIFFTGTYDDKSKAMEPKIKLFFQLLAASIAIFIVGSASFFPPVLSQLFTFFWIVGVINALNLIDNMNGLSPGTAALVSLAFGILSIVYFGNHEVAIISLGLAAVLFGFLPNNFPNAKIFMGDSGSMFLGYMLAMIGVLQSWQVETINISVLTPILLLAYPIFDVTFVTINRIRSGRPIYLGGKDHSSHLLVKYGFSPKYAVLAIYGLSFLTAFITYYINTLDLGYAATACTIILSTFLLLGFVLTKLHDKEYMPKGKNNVVIDEKTIPITSNINKEYKKVQ